jgi:class 3 adenylate cyclase
LNRHFAPSFVLPRTFRRPSTRAIDLVRDHFAFLAARVQRHGRAIAKTVGDAVMGAFRSR